MKNLKLSELNLNKETISKLQNLETSQMKGGKKVTLTRAGRSCRNTRDVPPPQDTHPNCGCTTHDGCPG